MLIPGLFGTTYVGSLEFLERVPLVGSLSITTGEHVPQKININGIINEVSELIEFH